VEAVLAADELGQGCGPSGEDNKELPRLGWAGLALTLTFILFCKPKIYIVRRYGKKV
jgi:hypothetical protein